MPFNKYLVEEKNTILQRKLEKLASNLTTGGTFETQEETISEVIRVLESFYKDLKEPIFTPEVVLEGDNPDPSLFNRIWNQILDDLTIIFNELENLEDLTINSFNFITTEHGRLLSRLKNVSSILGDYILYSSNPTRDAFYFKDSFNDLSRIDVNSQLLNQPQCEVDQDQGIVLLPVNKDKESSIKITFDPVINNNSNGAVGNNEQVGAVYNGDPKVILDNNPDTWFEYEKVVEASSDTTEPLVLDITINLGTEQVVNYIRINPNNFGTKTAIVVKTIETSLDGKVYTNVKDDIPIGDFLTKDEDNVFVLAPSTSKYAGQGIYSFTPRKSKYVHFVFEQNEPYAIETVEGEKLRYAIGIRDIDIRGIQYLPEGELVSEQYEFVTEEQIRKVALSVNQNPIEESTLASISYFISPDNGQTWNAIRPKSVEGFANEEATIPEILDYNGSDENTISTTVPVTGLRLKAVLKRNDETFENGNSSFRKETKSRSEIHKVPAEAPFEIVLEQPLVEGTLQILDPLFGSRGRPEYQYIISNGSTQKQYFYLPLDNFKTVYKKTLADDDLTWNLEVAPIGDWLHILVGGEEWTAATQPLTSYNADYSTAAAFRLFTFDPKKGLLKFGNGSDTMAPPAGVPISMYLEAERVFPEATAGAHNFKLELNQPSDKTRLVIKRYELPNVANQVIDLKTPVIQLAHKNVDELGTIPDVLESLGYTDQVTYLNGKDELTQPEYWSIDTENGIIYLGEETSASERSTFDYTYQEITELSENDWEFITVDSPRDTVRIKDHAWKTIHVDDTELPTTNGILVLDLAHFNIVKDTVEFELLDGTDENGLDVVVTDEDIHPLLKEVPFIDGVTEFRSEKQSVTEWIPKLLGANGQVNNYYILKHPITSDTNYSVSFNLPSMVTGANAAAGYWVRENEALETVGDWWIDRTPSSPTYGKLQRRCFASPPIFNFGVFGPGYITYYYDTTTVTTGLYSIDYKMGRVYLQRPMLGGNWTLTASYQYTDYRVEYDIVRTVPPESYVVNRTDNSIKFNDTEILRINTLARELLNGQELYYQVTYDYVSESRESILELKDYFSPVLKDYVLKVITKGQLV